MRTLVRIGIGIAAVLVLLVVGAIVAIKTIDPNTLIAPVQAQVKSATGRDLSVRGTAHVALSLHPRIVLTDVVLSNAPWGTAKELARIERLELAAALMPLLSRRFELEEIVLVKPVVALETDGKGQKNWQPPGATASSPQAGRGGGGLAAAIAVGEVTINEGVFTYQDGPKAAVLRVVVDKLATRSRPLASDVGLEFRGSVGDVPVAVEGTVGSFETLMARTSAYPIDVKGQVAGQPFALATRIKADPPRYVFDDLKLALGANAMQGSFSADMGGPRPKVMFDLAAPALALSAIPVPAIPAQATPPANAARHYLIPDTAVTFAPLRWVDADGKLAIGKLTLASGKTFGDIKLAFTNTDARFDMPQFSAGAFGGTLDGSAKIDATRSDMPTINVKLAGRGLTLGALLAAAGHPREVRGGSTDLAIDLAMRGDSPHEWASTATGNVRLVSGKATLVNTKVDPAVMLDKLNEAINPFRSLDASTELVCAVVRFPITNGVAHVERSIAMETSKLGVSASGTLDFRNETLDFQFNPKVRKGISIDIAGLNLADLVRVTGPFASPHVAIDAAGSVKIIASVGAAIGTSGLSAVAQQLLSWADGSGPGPCQVALEGGTSRAAQTAGASNAQPAVPIASDIGKALGKLFGR
jgi:AsmA family protein